MKRPNIPCTCTMCNTCDGCLAYSKYQKYLRKKRLWYARNRAYCRRLERARYVKMKTERFSEYLKKYAKNVQWQHEHRALCNAYCKKSKALKHA